VCFHTDDKLRTVLWGWAGDPLTDEERAVLELLLDQLDGELGTRLRGLLTSAEVRATVRRAQRLLDSGVFPLPSGDWPAIPWPPF
jgi:uncharacterized repeat protein (TIGR03843 family)